MKYSKDGRVAFCYESNTYKLEEKYLQGVTGLINKFKLPFDDVAIATKYAAKYGLNVDEVLLDWKTNKDISYNGYGKRMLVPFAVYPDATFFHYSIQLSIYKVLCKEYPIKEAYIIHLKETDYEIMSIEQMTIPECVLSNKC